jgi:ATP-dependent DNA ligase
MKISKRIEPMEARSVDDIPTGSQWQYEPKWDGFRCLIERSGKTVTLTSKSGQDLTRYFPEVARAAAALPEGRFLLDGELVVPIKKQLSFDALLQRIHPAASRVERLSRETPGVFLAFDILVHGKKNLLKLYLTDRRRELEDFATRCFPRTLFRLSPASTNLKDAKRWLRSAGGGSDGIIAKRRDVPYQAGNRDGMRKIKRYRSADCVIGGFRYGERAVAGRRVVGSLLLGLYDTQGKLHHVGFTSAIKQQEKPALTARLKALVTGRSFTGNMPGGPSRWSTNRSSEWTPVKPKLVIEVSYDHFSAGRFRHGTTILRWRPDKSPQQCTMAQFQEKLASVEPIEAIVD